MSKLMRCAVVSIAGVALLVPAVMGAGASAASASAGRAVRRDRNSSEYYNWSGYGTSGSYSSVTGSWTVPAVSATAKATDSATWIGIDGLKNSNLIQTGTEQDYFGGAAHYDAWWEILPAPETRIPSLTVSPGDAMTAAIAKLSGTSWSITITDTTTGKSFTINKTYKGKGQSVEWIQERPTVGGSYSTLAKYGEVTFTGITANGANPALTTASEIFMVNNSGKKILSSPSVPSASGNAFSVAYGRKSPPPPPAEG